jgi:hypothetical protein
MVQFINLPCLDIIPDILPVLTENALDAKHEFPMRPLGRKLRGRTTIIPDAGLVW